MKVVVLKSAAKDLEAIHWYLVIYGNNPPAKFRQSFDKFCVQIVNTPYIWPIYTHAPDYRMAVLEYGYLLFYKINENAGLIKIYRVLHGKRNIESIVN